jgi:hypothetical protein
LITFACLTLKDKNMIVKIKDLKKSDKFLFNHMEYTVIKKYVDDDHPLKATEEPTRILQLFHHDELEVEKIT